MPAYRTMSVLELTPGSILVTSVFDQHMTKLLDSGTSVDGHLINRLAEMGVTDVMVESAATTIVRRPRTPLPAGVRITHGNSAASPAPVERCSGCGATIAINPPVPEAQAAAWLCKTCGAVYFGRRDAGENCAGVAPTLASECNPFAFPVEVNLDAQGKSIPPEQVQRMMRSLEKAKNAGANARRHKRYPVAVPVTAIPLASDFRIAGEPERMTTMNVSLGGAALIHTRFIDAPYLALDFTAAGVELLQVVLKVLRVRSVGPVYKVAGEFISQLSQRP